jgi:hypothetical protein
MRFETSTTVEEQIKLLATELERTRSDLRALQRQHRRSALSTRFFYLSGLILIVSLSSIAYSPSGVAQKMVTHFEAPFIVEDNLHNTIVEISDEPGKKGLTVFGPKGGSVGLGTSNAKGLILFQDAGQKTCATIDEEGFKFEEGDHNVVFVGKVSSGPQISVNGDNGSPIASLVRGTNGGKLELSNSKGEVMVAAGTWSTGVGLVQTGPMSRAPGGLMGVPGSFISGKK